MGADQSVPVPQDSEEEEEEEENDEEEEEEEEEEDEAEDNNGDSDQRRKATENNLVKKVLQQEPEMLPCYASASPLSPQLSSLGTPRLGPSIKVWDPYNVLAPHPHPHMAFPRSFSQGSVVDEDRGPSSPATEVFLISHGECELGLRPDLIGGRCPEAGLTGTGKRQARALAVFLNSQGVRFNAVYSSPLDRARSMAVSVCQEMNFTEDQIQTSETLTEMSQGHWEGCLRSEIYSSEMTSFIENSQPDFSAPAGESLRQVEFRMVSFLNGTVLSLHEKLRSDISLNNPHSLIQVSKPGLQRKKSGKSRLQIMTTVRDREAEDETSSQEHDHRDSNSNSLHDLSGRSSSYNHSCIGIFSHAVPIKCLLTGILGCSPLMSNKICVEDSSVTVLQHSWETGWQIKKLNETAHLRLL